MNLKFGVRPAEGNDRFDEALEQSVFAESLGFDSVWFGEHYCSGDYWWPSPLLVLAGIASHTKKIKLGTNILIGPLYHPVYLAHSLALLDQMSRGRAVCGLGAGYDQKEFKAFGISMRERLGRLREMIPLMRRLWQETSVSFEGKYFPQDGFEPCLHSWEKREIPVWVGAWGDQVLKMVRSLDCVWVPGPTASLETLLERYKYFSEDCPSQTGSEPKPLVLVREVIIDETEQAAWDRAVELLYPKYETYVKRGHPFVQYNNRREFEEFARERFIVGSPQSCLEQLQSYSSALPIQEFILKVFCIGMSNEETKAKMKILAEKVLPKFK
ncbi:MAG: LLM class flavin-dependent oxidoreductase [Firmicutes bacterium]|nr:LLM class flavin-dependent oxidoreductase [Bacillota bacterium]